MVSFGDDILLTGRMTDTERKAREFDLRWSLSRQSEFNLNSVADIRLDESRSISEGASSSQSNLTLDSVPDTLPPGDYFVFLEALLDGGTSRATGRAESMLRVLGDPRTVNTGATVRLDSVSPTSLAAGETVRVRWTFSAETNAVAQRVDGVPVDVEVLFIADLQQNPQYSRILGRTDSLRGMRMDAIDAVTFTGEFEASFPTYVLPGSAGHVAVRVTPRSGADSIQVPTTSNAVEVQAR